MRTSAAGNKFRFHRGFTLLELLVVLAIVAMASAGITLAFEDSSQTQLDKEAQRLSALLESARAQSRASGVPVRWKSQPDGFAFEGLSAHAQQVAPKLWQSPGMLAESNTVLVLGPEPLIAPQSVRLWLKDFPTRSLWVSTDGVRPFSVRTTNPLLTP